MKLSNAWKKKNPGVKSVAAKVRLLRNVLNVTAQERSPPRLASRRKKGDIYEI